MQAFWGVAFLIIIAIALFAIQNSSAPPVVMKFLVWKYETSLIYTILGSIIVGIVMTLLFWIPMAIRTSFRRKKLDQRISPSKASTSP